MSCEDATYRISCELERIAYAIGQPTDWDVAAVVISAIAALGTIGIAAANLALIKRQHDLQLADRSRDARIRRIEFGTALRSFFNTVIRQKDDPSIDEVSAQYQNVSMLGARSGEPSAENLRDYVHQRSSFAREPFRGMRLELPTIRDCFDLISAWEQEPDSASADPKNAWNDHVEMIEKTVAAIKEADLQSRELLNTLFRETES